MFTIDKYRCSTYDIKWSIHRMSYHIFNIVCWVGCEMAVIYQLHCPCYWSLPGPLYWSLLRFLSLDPPGSRNSSRPVPEAEQALRDEVLRAKRQLLEVRQAIGKKMYHKCNTNVPKMYQRYVYMYIYIHNILYIHQFIHIYIYIYRLPPLPPTS